MRPTDWRSPLTSGPAPDCHLDQKDVEHCAKELAKYMNEFSNAFGQRGTRETQPCVRAGSAELGGAKKMLSRWHWGWERGW